MGAIREGMGSNCRSLTVKELVKEWEGYGYNFRRTKGGMICGRK